MVTITPVSPLPATKVDKAPQTSSRKNPAATVSTDKTLADVDPVLERRRDPERRRRPRGGQAEDRVMDQRLGAERRKRSVDISV